MVLLGASVVLELKVVKDNQHQNASIEHVSGNTIHLSIDMAPTMAHSSARTMLAG